MTKEKPANDPLDWLGLTNAPNWRVSRPLGRFLSGVLGVLFLLAIAAAFVMLLRIIFPSLAPAGADSSGTGSLGAGALIVALLGAPFLIWSTILKHRTVGFQKESHLTDSIARAVEQIGAEKTVKRTVKAEDGTETTVELTEPNIEVRIGGLLLLDRIARASTEYDKGRDHVRIMEILCAYIRENAKARKVRDFPLAEWTPLPDNPTTQQRSEHSRWQIARFVGRPESNAQAWVRTIPQIRSDVAMALSIIGNRDKDQAIVEAAYRAPNTKGDDWIFSEPCPTLTEEPQNRSLSEASRYDFLQRFKAWKSRILSYSGFRLNLSDLNLQGANLTGARLDGANLRGTRLDGAILIGARLIGADLTKASLVGADMTASRLEGAKLIEAFMEGATLGRAVMTGANFEYARMEGAELELAHLEAANLVGTRLEWVDLRGARMQLADLTSARLDTAKLGQARMQWALLSEARMREAELHGAHLEGVVVEGTQLQDTRLSVASVRSADWSSAAANTTQLASMFGDASVILPGGVTPGHPNWPVHWPTWVLPDSPDEEVDFQSQWRRWQADPASYTPPPPPKP